MNNDLQTAIEPTGLLKRYAGLLAAGDLTPDAAQEAVAKRLQNLHDALIKKPEKVGFLASIFGKKGPPEPPRGLYIHGGVGRGKSMLMDLFYNSTTAAPKRRVHFHEFMQECHANIHKWRQVRAAERAMQNGTEHGDDPIPPLAAGLAKHARLLCFDEFQVTDVADAMILSRLFTALFQLGVTIVATSNRVPQTLYEGGLNRDLFLPFIDLINDRLDVLELNGPTDYRLKRMQGLRTYHVPINEATTTALKEAFWQLTDRDVGDPATVPSEEITVKGRQVFVPKVSKGAAVFSFKRLCADPAMPLGAADYLAIAWRYHTVFVVAIPQMNNEMRNEAKRFVTLIDTLYDNNVKLFCSAAVPPEELYPEGDGSFEFARTASRLVEMQSEDYLARGHAI